ncbi:hypothetical protein [Floccifex sp.]|uniref:hypothetical protein n=1 Tax=Floccifex sp. TaxID=2815810 RepID=UPI003F0BC823
MIDRIRKTKVEQVGKNTWKDEKDNYYILNIDKTKFLKLDVKQYNIYHFLEMRTILALITFFLLEYYSYSIFLAILAGIVVYVVMASLNRYWLLPSLPEYYKATGNFETSFLDRFKNTNRRQCFTGMMLSLVVSILLVYNFISMDYQITYLWDTNHMQQLLTTWIYILFTILLITSTLLYLYGLISKKR